MRHRCSCGKLAKVSLQSLMHRKGCGCGRKIQRTRRRYDITSVKKLFAESGCQLLDNQYRNANTPMRYRCHCGRFARIALQNFLKGDRCGCGRKAEGLKRRHTFYYVKRYFSDQGCQLLQDSYTDSHTPMLFRCDCGNTARISFSDFQNGVRCGCRRHLGMNRKWNEERVVEELKTLIAKSGSFPSAYSLRKSNKGPLCGAVESLGGFNYFRDLLQRPLDNKPQGYWSNWDNVERELRARFPEMIARGVCPNSRMLQEAGIWNSIIASFGGLPRLADRLKCEPCSCWKVRDGHFAYSFYEFIFDEYLYSRGIPHQPHMRVCSTHRYACDQRIGEYYVEIFGYGKSDKNLRAEAYCRKRTRKERLYKQLGLKLVPIEKEVFLEPYAHIEKQLDRIVAGLGIKTDKQHSFDIAELAQAAGIILTEEEVLRQLKQIVQEIGDFPKQKQFYAIGRVDLLERLNKTGGLNHYRRKLGYEPAIKPNNYWTLEQTLKALKEQSDDVGRLPREKEMKGALAAAVQRHGGLNRLGGMLGLRSAKKLSGWWKNRKILLRTLRNEVGSALGHFPSDQELLKMGRFDLRNAIARSGGFMAIRRLYERG